MESETMGFVEEGERLTFATVDDLCLQVLRSAYLRCLTHGTGRSPGQLTPEEHGDILAPWEKAIEHEWSILKSAVRQAATMSESDVLAELEALGVERELVEVVGSGGRL